MATSKTEPQFIKVYDECAHDIYRFCFFRVYRRDIAEEIMQDAFMRTWRMIADGQQIENIRALVYKIARNLIIDHSRKHKEASLDQLMEAGWQGNQPTRQDEFYNKIDTKLIIESIKKVDEDFQEILLLRYVNDLPPREIAKILELSPNLISVRIHRGVKQLKQIIKYGLKGA